MGDASDNIPGVPGIGEKTALSLIKEFESLDNLYDSLDSVTRKSVREKLETYKEQAYMSRELATIDRNVPSLCNFEDLERMEINRKPMKYLRG